MSNDDFRVWLSDRMKQLKLSQVALAQESGLSQHIISVNLSGKRNPTSDFCIKIALALNEPIEKVLRIAGILPASHIELPESVEGLAVELVEIAQSLPLAKQEELLRFARFLKSG